MLVSSQDQIDSKGNLPRFILLLLSQSLNQELKRVATMPYLVQIILQLYALDIIKHRVLQRNQVILLSMFRHQLIVCMRLHVIRNSFARIRFQVKLRFKVHKRRTLVRSTTLHKVMVNQLKSFQMRNQIRDY